MPATDIASARLRRHHHAVAAPRLGLVQRGVGELQPFIDVAGAREQRGDADAGGHVQLGADLHRDGLDALLDAMPLTEPAPEARELTHVLPGLAEQHLRMAVKRVTKPSGRTELVLLSIELLAAEPPG